MESLQIRPPEGGEYEQIAACFKETRGLNYYSAEYYNAKWLEIYCELFAAFDRGELVGAAGLSEGLGSGERTTGCLLTVRPGFTGRGVAKALIRHFTSVLRARGARSVKGQVVTSHTGVQTIVERMGWVPTGFLLGARDRKNAVPSQEGASALVLYAGKLSAKDAGTLYIHTDVADIARRLYTDLGAKVKLIENSEILSSNSQLSALPDAHNRALYVRASECGAGLIGDLEALRRGFTDMSSVTVLLNLCDRSAVYGYEALRDAGYRFCGFDLLGQRENAVLYLGEETADIRLTERAEKLKREVDMI